MMELCNKVIKHLLHRLLHRLLSGRQPEAEHLCSSDLVKLLQDCTAIELAMS